MFTTPQLSAGPTSVALALLLAATPSFATDPVRASFDRMLTHEPVATAPPAAPQAPADPLIAALVVPLRDGVKQAVPMTDAVAQSFERMLTHSPNWVAPPVPAGLGDDPLLAAMVEPLRQWLAQSASVTTHAAAPSTRAEH